MESQNFMNYYEERLKEIFYDFESGPDFIQSSGLRPVPRRGFLRFKKLTVIAFLKQIYFDYFPSY
jgi:hypothetical protein